LDTLSSVMKQKEKEEREEKSDSTPVNEPETET
jgi:hypothetical protein